MAKMDRTRLELVQRKGAVSLRRTASGWRIDIRIYVYEGDRGKTPERWGERVRRLLVEVWPIREEEERR